MAIPVVALSYNSGKKIESHEQRLIAIERQLEKIDKKLDKIIERL